MYSGKIYSIPDRLNESALISSKKYVSMYESSVIDPINFWASQAEEFLTWDKKWDHVLEHDFHRAEVKWFLGGKLNVCYNCLDRHLENKGEKKALIWEGNEPGDTKSFTYREVFNEVCKIANVLKKLGVSKGDRVALYMPMVPELPFAMLACARIGAVHSVIFGGFSAESIKSRIEDSRCKLVFTSNEGLRGEKTIPLKETMDEALADVDCVEHVLVQKRTDSSVNMKNGRDLWLHEETATVDSSCPCESMDSEDPLFILYTSGSTGSPKGVLHTQAGYLLHTAITHKYVFDYHENDIYFCAADIGWITGHSYIVYGPLCNGATTVMFESVPNYPDAGRYWDVISRHKVNIFYTAPTAIRAVAKSGDHLVDNYDLSSLRVLGSVGEPINEDAWKWYFDRIGKGKCAIVDTWWQTETGGIMITPLPGAIPTKAGSASRPFFGVQPCLVDEDGKELEKLEAKGRLCIKFPWPGQARTLYGDHERFIETYFSLFPGLYFTGDACSRDKDGYYWISGRVDDVLNVSGHRLGTAEIESALVSSGVVAEAAVVGMPHDVKGQGIYAYCILKDNEADDDTSKEKVKQAVKKRIGGVAVPDVIQFVPGLPKTRSGKIMRRILRKIAEGETENFGDTSTLADSSIPELIARERTEHV